MFKKLNKKGFTLIELLAVIIILAILIAVAVPAVTRYLDGARKDTFVTNAKAAIQAVADDVVINGMKNPNAETNSATYDYQTINRLLDTKLDQSPFGKSYSDKSFITVKYDSVKQEYTYSICLVDDGNNGFSGTAEQPAVAYDSITRDNIKVGNAVACQ